LEDEEGADEGEEAGEFWEDGESFGLWCCHGYRILEEMNLILDRR
jgi:hypothetical protein